MRRDVRIGVLGLRRGAALARLARQAGMRVVAIRALERGLSVLSETAACRTLAESVALVEATERSAGIYMFAENYPYMPFVREMRRRYAAGDIGEVRYVEAEYLDEPADLAAMGDDRSHWRARTPATYYCTHSLAPVAAITGARPVEVSAFVVPSDGGPEALDRARRGRGWAALLVVRLDNGAVCKSLHGFLEAGQQSWVRIHGDRGLMESLRQGDTRTLRVVWDVVDEQGGRRAEEVFRPWPPGIPPTAADPLGDDVAETLMLRDFAGRRHGRPPARRPRSGRSPAGAGRWRRRRRPGLPASGRRRADPRAHQGRVAVGMLGRPGPVGVAELEQVGTRIGGRGAGAHQLEEPFEHRLVQLLLESLLEPKSE